jgi:hypothetical protein
MNLPKKAMPNMATSKMYPVVMAALSVALVSWFMVLGFEVKRMCVGEAHPSVGLVLECKVFCYILFAVY